MSKGFSSGTSARTNPLLAVEVGGGQIVWEVFAWCMSLSPRTRLNKVNSDSVLCALRKLLNLSVLMD